MKTHMERVESLFKQIGLNFLETQWKGDKVVVIGEKVNLQFDPKNGQFKGLKIWEDK